ncbi:hypothetical protein EI94DRAFT_1704610 [Lactarius quietus]|nr:hypothetical protein EI94DRAFT_1704610 [Lactarius quietus]
MGDAWKLGMGWRELGVLLIESYVVSHDLEAGRKPLLSQSPALAQDAEKFDKGRTEATSFRACIGIIMTMAPHDGAPAERSHARHEVWRDDGPKDGRDLWDGCKKADMVLVESYY